MKFEYAVHTGKVIAKDRERNIEKHACYARNFEGAYAVIRNRHGIGPKGVLMLRPIGDEPMEQESNA